jgi:hypothetical protein
LRVQNADIRAHRERRDDSIMIARRSRRLADIGALYGRHRMRVEMLDCRHETTEDGSFVGIDYAHSAILRGAAKVWGEAKVLK